jgi:hypothetical protein
MKTKCSIIVLMVFLCLLVMDRPGIGGGKRTTLLPALIWNPLHYPSGDSLNQVLIRAGYQSTLTDSLGLYMDSLSNYHLFIIGGIYEEEQWDAIREPLIHPYLHGIYEFLGNGGSLFWEGASSYDDVNDFSGDTLFRYLPAGSVGVFNAVPYFRGASSTPFDNIDSLTYISSSYLADLIGGPGATRVLTMRNLNVPLAEVASLYNTRTMLTNFLFEKVADSDVNTKVDLVNDIMDWLSGATGVNEEKPKPIPKEFGLTQNYPNPFNAQTTIQYALPKESEVRLEVYDILGKRVATLVDGIVPAGFHRIVWDASWQASGVYFYKISAIGENRCGRMTLLR